MIFTAFIEKNTWSGLEDFYSNLVRAIHAEMLQKGTLQGRRKSKKRKNGKAMQHQTSTVTSNDNDEDDDEDVDDIRTNSNGEKSVFCGLTLTVFF